MQTRLPGYRDRIAHVSLHEETEGGLNLNMPPELIVELGERGERAARLLIRSYEELIFASLMRRLIAMTGRTRASEHLRIRLLGN